MKSKNLFFKVDTSPVVRDLGLLAMRVILACMMFSHGVVKLQNFAEMSEVFPDPIGLGSKLSLILLLFAETGCSVLLFFGFFTRWATLPLIFGMLVAAFVQHAGDPFSAKELAVLFLGMYCVLLLLGPGSYSIDAVIQNQFGKKPKRRKYPRE